MQEQKPNPAPYVMNQEEFTKVVNRTVDSIKYLLITKGEEYAGTTDRLSNFKRGSKLTGTTPLQTALIYATKHYDSICTYIRKDASGEIQMLSEPIEGRFDDLINYCILMKAIIKEERINEEKRLATLPSPPITHGPYENIEVI